jgi:hypothetical protein
MTSESLTAVNMHRAFLHVTLCILMEVYDVRDVLSRLLFLLLGLFFNFVQHLVFQEGVMLGN